MASKGAEAKKRKDPLKRIDCHERWNGAQADRPANTPDKSLGITAGDIEARLISKGRDETQSRLLFGFRRLDCTLASRLWRVVHKRDESAVIQ